jgi:polysaccharide pyruvyl transferase WcaK-like protein
VSTNLERRKIALFGNFGAGNLGNECTLQAMMHNVRRYLPKAEISCVCPMPEKTTSNYSIPAFPVRAPFPIGKVFSVWRKNHGEVKQPGFAVPGTPGKLSLLRKAHATLRVPLRTVAYPLLEPYRWFKAIASLKGNDMLIMTGTGMLGDFGIRPFSLHYDILMWSIIARLCRCELSFVSVGAGPIRHPLSRCFVKAALTLAHYRSYRDAFSKDYLEGMGFDVENDAVYPDLAFSLPRSMVAANHGHAKKGIVIGVGLMNYHDRRDRPTSDKTIYLDYIANLATFVVRLLERNFTVRLLIGDLVYDQDVRQDLRKVLEERGVKYGDGKIVDEAASSAEELLSQLASTDAVVASRFHNILLALMLRKPVVAISYHEKFESLMRGVGLAEFCQDIESIDIEKLIAKVTSLRENVHSIEVRIARETETYRVALDEQYERIFKVPSVISPGPDTAGKRASIRRSAELVSRTQKSARCG